MDASVVLAADAASSLCAHDALLFVGQRRVTATGVNQQRAKCIVFEAIPCSDLDVILEQVECLEKVLPCGIVFLGVFLPDGSIKVLMSLRHLLKNHPHASLFFAATHDKARKIQCQLLQSGKTLSVSVLETKPMFVTMACYFRSPLRTLPFIVRSRSAHHNKNSVILNVTSTTVMEANEIWNAADSIYAVQLGGREGQYDDCMMCVDVTFAPLFSSGKDVYCAISSLIPKVEGEPQSGMVRLLSQRYPGLIYQWIFTPMKGNAAILSMQQWDELNELIEDGAGEEVEPSQVLTDTFLRSPSSSVGNKKERVTNAISEHRIQDSSTTSKPVGRKEGLLMKYIPCILAGFIALILAFLWAK